MVNHGPLIERSCAILEAQQEMIKVEPKQDAMMSR